ncbi:APC family permease [Pseudonocardia acaciae]|uniref:APC family permease n=1 Tax=Pseudonocardia acaciae TaxID=551276 RepID=UPI000685FA97|nr:amino acid permease [Pseudonocardia acaciae]
MNGPPTDDEQLRALGYEQKFTREMSLWATFALGFLYLSPLVGVIALFGQGLSTAGPPSIFWIVIVAGGQWLVALVFGEVVSQYPLAGGLYQWARRLWGGRYAWWLSWVYLFTVMIGITTTALFSADFVASLFLGTAEDPGASAAHSPGATLLIAVVVAALGLVLNATGTKTLARIAKIGLAAELVGVIAVGLYLLVFQRHNSFSVLFDSMGTGAGGYFGPFLAASLVGLLLFYGFEACGEVAEEVPNPARRIPFAMQLTVLVGGGAALLAFAGYLLAAPDLPAIVSGADAKPIPSILQAALGTVGTKIFLVIALTSFLACVMGQQAAASRLVYSFARDRMFPGSGWFAVMSARRRVPLRALLSVNAVPVLLFVFAYFAPDSIFRIAAFQMLAGYCAFQMVVLAALRARLRGWRPAGPFTLGRAGLPVTVAALGYGVLAMVVLSLPSGDADLPFYDRWIALIGFLVVAVAGLVYLLTARPDRASDAPQGDAIEVAERMRARRRQPDAALDRAPAERS